MGLRKKALAGTAVVTAAVLAVSLTGGLGAQAAGQHTETTTTAPAKKRADTVITLITGDRVVLKNSDIKQVAVTPGKGRERVTFKISRTNGRLSVIPLDVSSAVTSGRLDRRLFDISGLLEMKYDDAHAKAIPLLITSAGPRARKAMPGATVVRELPAAGLAALKVDKRAASQFFTGLGSAARTRSTDKIWLDAKRRTTLDQSVPQIGAPAAWKSGYTGKGVRVAVVDTGIDSTHPDFKGQVVAAKNFTTGPAGDGFGHGTHVASTIAGTAAASNGKYKGVAPDAKLVDAKVCDNDGGCEDSAILAGLEWAVVQQKARVVNVSLGGLDGPEVDPIEAAVNRLTAQTGALFVVAAGNDGPEVGSVNSPGSADAALTVGAVDKKDALADFSSRGPRVGDSGIKPDVTAPGVGIVAAKAKYSVIGDPVGKGYLSLDGTSMATPHTAGAAALLMQQHPSWKATELKAALMTTAKHLDGLTPYEQGAGRIDVANAVTDSVLPVPGSLSFGTALWPHQDDKPVVKQLTYRNLGAKPVTLSLTVSSTVAGKPVEAFKLSASSLTIAAGESASVSVTSDTRHNGPDGLYSGRVVATAPGVSIGTPLVVEKEIESYDVIVKHLLPNGNGTDRNYSVIYGIDKDYLKELVTDAQGVVKLRLPKGRYFVDGLVGDDAERFYQLVWPKLTVDKATALTVDARKAKPATMTLPRKGTKLVEAQFGYWRSLAEWAHEANMATSDLSKLYVGSMGAPASADEMVSWANSRWVVPGKAGGLRNAPYSYNLVQTKRGDYYTGYHRVVHERGLAKVRTQYTADHAGLIAADSRFAWLPGVGATTAGIPIEYDVPATATHFFDAQDYTWVADVTQIVRRGEDEDYPLGLSSDDTKLTPGRSYRERWGAAVANAGFGSGDGTYRTGNELTVFMFPVSDQDGHAGTALSYDQGVTRLYRNGKLLAGDDTSAGQLLVENMPADKSSYRLEVSLQRSLLQLATRVDHVWTFSSQDTGEAKEVLPLRSVEFRPVVDANNAVERTTVTKLPFAVVHQPGAKVPGIRSVGVEVSGDGGKTWQKAIVVRRADGTYTAVFKTPAAKVVSLRSVVADKDGNTATQTVINAYRNR
jgi:subtilisin family serine protease